MKKQRIWNTLLIAYGIASTPGPVVLLINAIENYTNNSTIHNTWDNDKYLLSSILLLLVVFELSTVLISPLSFSNCGITLFSYEGETFTSFFSSIFILIKQDSKELVCT